MPFWHVRMAPTVIVPQQMQYSNVMMQGGWGVSSNHMYGYPVKGLTCQSFNHEKRPPRSKVMQPQTGPVQPAARAESAPLRPRRVYADPNHTKQYIAAI